MRNNRLANHGLRTTDELQQWSRQQTALGATRFSLRERATDGADQVVHEFSASASLLSEEIHARMADDMRFSNGQESSYYVCAYRGAEPIARIFLEHEPERESMKLVHSAQNADVCAQLMRHNEVNSRLAVGQTLHIINHYKDELEAKSRALKESEDRYWKVMDLYESLRSVQHEQEIEKAKMAQAEKRDEFLREKFEMYLPIVLSKILSASGKGESKILGEEVLRQLLKSLSESQIDAIASTLTPDQGALLGQIYATYAERECAQEASKAGQAPATPPRNGNGANNPS